MYFTWILICNLNIHPSFVSNQISDLLILPNSRRPPTVLDITRETQNKSVEQTFKPIFTDTKVEAPGLKVEPHELSPSSFFRQLSNIYKGFGSKVNHDPGRQTVSVTPQPLASQMPHIPGLVPIWPKHTQPPWGGKTITLESNIVNGNEILGGQSGQKDNKGMCKYPDFKKNHKMRIFLGKNNSMS